MLIVETTISHLNHTVNSYNKRRVVAFTRAMKALDSFEQALVKASDEVLIRLSDRAQHAHDEYITIANNSIRYDKLIQDLVNANGRVESDGVIIQVVDKLNR